MNYSILIMRPQNSKSSFMPLNLEMYRIYYFEICVCYFLAFWRKELLSACRAMTTHSPPITWLQVNSWKFRYLVFFTCILFNHFSKNTLFLQKLPNQGIHFNQRCFKNRYYTILVGTPRENKQTPSSVKPEVTCIAFDTVVAVE